MYPAYARWVQSHRDLPIKLNQWNNVVVWSESASWSLYIREFKETIIICVSVADDKVTLLLANTCS